MNDTALGLAIHALIEKWYWLSSQIRDIRMLRNNVVKIGELWISLSVSLGFCYQMCDGLGIHLCVGRRENHLFDESKEVFELNNTLNHTHQSCHNFSVFLQSDQRIWLLALLCRLPLISVTHNTAFGALRLEVCSHSRFYIESLQITYHRWRTNNDHNKDIFFINHQIHCLWLNAKRKIKFASRASTPPSMVCSLQSVQHQRSLVISYRTICGWKMNALANGNAPSHIYSLYSRKNDQCRYGQATTN